MLKQHKNELIFIPEKGVAVREDVLQYLEELQVEGILPFRQVTIDGQPGFFYHTESFVPLAVYRRQMNSQQMMSFVLYFLDILNKVKNDTTLQMLHLLLEEEHIYVQPENARLALVVLPVEQKLAEKHEKLNRLWESLRREESWSTLADDLVQYFSYGDVYEEAAVSAEKPEAPHTDPVSADSDAGHKNRTEELDWAVKMKQKEQKEKEEQQQESGVFFRRSAREQVADEERMQDREATFSIHPGTQVLRKNIWTPSGELQGRQSGFASAAPVKLSSQRNVNAGQKKEEKKKQLHFVSFANSLQVDFVIDRPYFIIGKNPAQADGVIQNIGTISREHCAISYKGQDVYIEDMGSTNHTYVNDQMLEPYSQKKITPRDTIRLGQERFAIAFK